MTMARADKQADLAGPGIGNYEELEKILPQDYRTLLPPRETQQAIFAIKHYIEEHLCQALHLFPQLKTDRYPNLPEEITFLHAEDLLEMYPDLPCKQRETAVLQHYPALFIIGIGWPLQDGYPHEMRAADYDDWVTETVSADGRLRHGLNGDILVWNPVTRRRHELMSGGIRVNAATLKQQLAMANQLDWLTLPYHQGVLNNELPLSIGGGIGQSRTQMLLLKKAHLGEVSVSVWPTILKDVCRKKNISLLE